MEAAPWLLLVIVLVPVVVRVVVKTPLVDELQPMQGPPGVWPDILEGLNVGRTHVVHGWVADGDAGGKELRYDVWWC